MRWFWEFFSSQLIVVLFDTQIPSSEMFIHRYNICSFNKINRISNPVNHYLHLPSADSLGMYATPAAKITAKMMPLQPHHIQTILTLRFNTVMHLLLCDKYGWNVFAANVNKSRRRATDDAWACMLSYFDPGLCFINANEQIDKRMIRTPFRQYCQSRNIRWGGAKSKVKSGFLSSQFAFFKHDVAIFSEICSNISRIKKKTKLSIIDVQG